MLAENPRVRLGLADWRRDDLAAAFYPADLPEDWRLTYYASEFSCVWLDCAAWRGLPEAVAQQWREETHCGFRFVLEARQDSSAAFSREAADAAFLAALDDRLAGPFCANHPALFWIEPGVDLRLLNDRLRAWLAGEGWGGDLYLLARKADFATLEQVGTLLDLYALR